MLLQSGRAFGAEDRRFVKLAFWSLALRDSSSRPPYDSTLAVVWPRILTVWFNCSTLSGFFKTVTGLICKILSSTSLSG